MFEEKYINYGVVKVPSHGSIDVYCGMYDYRSISVCGHFVSARWSGRVIIAEHEDGSTWRWDSFDHYDKI